jgi:hypothetical protein
MPWYGFASACPIRQRTRYVEDICCANEHSRRAMSHKKITWMSRLQTNLRALTFGAVNAGPLALGCATLLLIHCGHSDPKPRAVTSSPRASASATQASPLFPPTQHGPLRALVLGGSNMVTNAAWVGDEVVAITHRELWRMDPEKSNQLHITPLSRPVPVDSLLAVARSVGRVAVALEDGGVDVFEADGRLARTLPGGRQVIELHFAPDGAALAITRSNDKKGEWFQRTTVVDVSTGEDKFGFEGGGPVFDPESKRIAARAGVFEVETGRNLFPWRNGFQVLLDAGVYGDMKTARGEVVAGDYVARGFFQGTPFYMNTTAEKVSLFEQPNHETRIFAGCGGSKKTTTVADAAHGRLIGVCMDGVVITDFSKRTSTKIVVPIAKTMPMFPLDVLLSPTSTAFAVDTRDFPMTVVEPEQAASHRASAAEWDAFHASGDNCAGRAGATRGVMCDNPALRADGAYRIRVSNGITITSREGQPVADWGLIPRAQQERSRERPKDYEGQTVVWRGGHFSLRTSTNDRLLYSFAPSDSEAPGFAASKECGEKPYLRQSEDTFSFYTSYEGKNTVTAHIACHCTAKGCTRTAVLPPYEVLCGSADGAVASIDVNSTHTQTNVELRAPGRKALRTALAGGCIHGTFGSNGNLFVACNQDWRYEILELAASDLSVLHRHAAPPVGHVSALVRTDSGIAVMGATNTEHFGSVVDADWFTRNAPAQAELFLTSTFGILQSVNGKIQIAGNKNAAAYGIRCMDGDTLYSWDACRD